MARQQTALALSQDLPGLAPAQIFGKYRILHHLARGGMADIYLAEVEDPPGIRKTVVVKCILDEHASEPDFVQLFLHEARLAASLAHANIVRVLDAGLLDGKYFIAMEYIIGEELRVLQEVATSRGRRMPLEQSLSIAIALASGLHYAHEKTDSEGQPLYIVHRDVSPQNVLVTFEGEVKLLDFGIARSTAPDSKPTTGQGSVRGKPTYMSPEQCLGQSLDRRSDIFALGILLYEMTMGRRLFRRPSEFETMREIVEGQTQSPREVDPTYPARLDKIVMRALEREPLARHATALELQQELEAFASEASLDVSPAALGRFMETVFAREVKAWRRTAGEKRMRQVRPSIVLLDRVRAPALPVEQWPGLPANLEASRRRQHVVQFLRDNTRRIAAVAVPALIVSCVLGWQLGRASNQAAHAASALNAAPPTEAVAAAPAEAPALVAPAPRHPSAMPAVPSPTIANSAPAPKPVGKIVLTVTPPDAAVSLDGAPVGVRSPVRIESVEADRELVIVVHRDGYEDQTVRTKVKPDEDLKLTVRLHRARQSSRHASSARHSSSSHHAAATHHAASRRPPRRHR